METATDNDFTLLAEMRMRPRGAPPAEAQSTTSEEEQVEEDPTKDLPPIYTSDKSVDTPPPQRGEGWWGSETQFRCKISTVGGTFKTGLAYAAQGAGTHDNEGCRR